MVVTFSCNRVSTLSLSESNKDEVIAFQPLDDYDFKETKSTIGYIGIFFKRKVVVLPAINIPSSYFNAVVNRYSADSIITLLSRVHKGNFVEVIGLTNKDIYTIKEDPFMPYYDEDLIGFGYQPGNTCIISDRPYKNNDFRVQKLRNSILHEVGHNMGLSHCQNNKCAMFEKKAGTDHCTGCRKKTKGRTPR